MSFRGKGSFKYSNYLQSCQKTEKTNEAFLRKILELMDGWADVQKQINNFQQSAFDTDKR